MGLSNPIWTTPQDYFAAHSPAKPVLFFAPSLLHATAARFRAGFAGLVTYAVKANADDVVMSNLASAGLAGYDVASPVEMETVRRFSGDGVMHYNNPIRAIDEIDAAVAHGVTSYSVDCASELAKLAARVPVSGVEVTVRFKLPVPGAAYDFGEKFGATKEAAVGLLQKVAALGFIPSLTFHPGTQCTEPQAWRDYIAAGADIARQAGVRIARLNVGGGFPAERSAGDAPDLEQIFDVIRDATATSFAGRLPRLVCEPGRAMVADCYALATRVKAVRDNGQVYLNDGIYGGLGECPSIGVVDRIEVFSANGVKRTGKVQGRTVFGPTCDSLDRLPGQVGLAGDMVEGDHVLFHGLGAYSTATVTRFNGYGDIGMETVEQMRP